MFVFILTVEILGATEYFDGFHDDIQILNMDVS
jgi:hypothetical protein